MTIAILCPTRGRPEQCRRMIESAKKTGTDNVIYLGVNEEEIREYNNKMPIDQSSHLYVNDMWPTVYKWNHIADFVMRTNDCNLFMLGSDDMYFDTPGWDKALLDHYNALENKIHVYHLQDSRDPEGTPHPIFSREWIEFWGCMLNPMYLHWYVDTWAVTLAKANNCFTHMKDFSLVHSKPSDTGQGDSTHNRIRSWGWAERDRYVWDNSQQYLEFDKKRLAQCMKN